MASRAESTPDADKLTVDSQSHCGCFIHPVIGGRVMRIPVRPYSPSPIWMYPVGHTSRQMWQPIQRV
jgi:hypothetical protein